MKKEKSCGAVVFNDKREVLLVEHNRGHISFPKGHVEGLEEEWETAYREVLEETGIKCLIDRSIYEVITYMPKPDISKDVVFFKASFVSGIPIPQEEEIRKTNFYTISEALDIITYQEDKDILKRIIGSDLDEY